MIVSFVAEFLIILDHVHKLNIPLNVTNFQFILHSFVCEEMYEFDLCIIYTFTQKELTVL